MPPGEFHLEVFSKSGEKHVTMPRQVRALREEKTLNIAADSEQLSANLEIGTDGVGKLLQPNLAAPNEVSHLDDCSVFKLCEICHTEAGFCQAEEEQLTPRLLSSCIKRHVYGIVAMKQLKVESFTMSAQLLSCDSSLK